MRGAHCPSSPLLQSFHFVGFVHNDIKPGNILFSCERGAVVIDFGLSSEVGSRGVHTGGTPWYVPPEYARDGKRGAPGDVFALGVVMMYVVGRLPLPERHFKELWFNILDAYNAGSAAALAMGRWQDVVVQTARTLDAASSELERLVQRMVAPTPGARVALDRLAEEAAVLPEHE
ncbi:kinase-like protein [Trichocladium antarcticum]|uniref:Kinase-like protein n=1 Tax=Trichocladium antarcticum TaxID=1450529 RepID=A0AAN6ZIF4_9PEZI|nr:kinase-like protein [Trichocladium antarcticum]